MSAAWTKHDWDTSTDPRLMVAELQRRGIDRATLVLAIAPCVRLSFANMPPRARHGDALAAIERTARHEVGTRAASDAAVIMNELAEELADDDPNDPRRFVAEAIVGLADYLLSYFGSTADMVVRRAGGAIFYRVAFGGGVVDLTGRVPVRAEDDPLREAVGAEVGRRMAAILRTRLPWADVVRYARR